MRHNLRLSLIACLCAGVQSILPTTAPVVVPQACLDVPAAGAPYREETHLYAVNKTLELALDYYQFVDPNGFPAYCFITPEGEILTKNK